MAERTQDTTVKFPCNQCGLCCQQVGKAVLAARKANLSDPLCQEIASFPYKFDQSGRCEMLNPDNTCRIYENRPDICNMEKAYQKFYKGTPKSEFFNVNHLHCLALQSAK